MMARAAVAQAGRPIRCHGRLMMIRREPDLKFSKRPSRPRRRQQAITGPRP
jgi:hypothetical protein